MQLHSRAEAVAELKATYTILAADLDCVVAIGKQANTPFAQRMLVRTHFAFVEGLTHQLCQVASASVSLAPEVFTPAEHAMLRGETYDLDEQGHAISRPARLPLNSRIRLALAAYPRIHGAEFTPDFGGTGWESLQRAIKVRDRLMHPKSSQELTLSDTDLGSVVRGAAWFRDTVLALLRSCEEADKRHRDGSAA